MMPTGAGTDRLAEGFCRKRASNRGCFMDVAERDYFLERAEAEMDLANAARQRKAAHAHYNLASFYLDRALDGVANEN